MNEINQYRIKQMSEYYYSIKKDFMWENTLLQHFAALSYTMADNPYDYHEVKEMLRYIRQNAGSFSIYRTPSPFLYSFLLCINFENPQEAFNKMNDTHRLLKNEGFRNSPYLALANYVLVKNCSGGELSRTIEKGHDLYKMIKSNHPWLTGTDDYPLIMLMAMQDKSNGEILEEMENCYTQLNKMGFTRTNGLQFLSHILSLSGETVSNKVNRCVEINEKLKSNLYRVYSYHLGALGLLTQLSFNNEQIVSEVLSMADEIKHTKKYRLLGKPTILMLATSLASDTLVHSGHLDPVIGVSIEVIIQAQNAAMIAAASSAAAAASAGS